MFVECQISINGCHLSKEVPATSVSHRICHRRFVVCLCGERDGSVFMLPDGFVSLWFAFVGRDVGWA